MYPVFLLRQFVFLYLAPSAPQGERFTGYEFIPRVTVRWDPPSTPNGVIQLYTLYYRYLPDGNVTKVTINDPKARNKTVDVVGGFTYIFEISATTVEEGPKSRITDTVPEYGMIYQVYKYQM